MLTLSVRPLRTNCWMVGTGWYLFRCLDGHPWRAGPCLPAADHRLSACVCWFLPCELRTGASLLATFRKPTPSPGHAQWLDSIEHRGQIYALDARRSKRGRAPLLYSQRKLGLVPAARSTPQQVGTRTTGDGELLEPSKARRHSLEGRAGKAGSLTRSSTAPMRHREPHHGQVEIRPEGGQALPHPAVRQRASECRPSGRGPRAPRRGPAAGCRLPAATMVQAVTDVVTRNPGRTWASTLGAQRHRGRVLADAPPVPDCVLRQRMSPKSRSSSGTAAPVPDPKS